MAISAFAEFESAVHGGIPPELLHYPRWYACYTRARTEKAVAGQLGRNGIESFLPTYPRTRQWKDRKKVVDWPLFPSYVFGRFQLSEMHAVLTTAGVATIVRTNGCPTPIPEGDLENVRRFAERLATAGIEPRPQPMLGVGERVRVIGGPLEGVEAVVTSVRSRRRVLVGLETIGHGLEVDIDSKLLRPLKG